ncbi:MAG: hypothetical protein O3A31_13035 [Planctomycetota bacterium]|nr:hypothetical protein [Planctomycetota bacterium]
MVSASRSEFRRGFNVGARGGPASTEERSDDAERVKATPGLTVLDTQGDHGRSSDADIDRTGHRSGRVGHPHAEARQDLSKSEQWGPRGRIHSELVPFAVDADFMVADGCGDIGLDVQGRDH